MSNDKNRDYFFYLIDVSNYSIISNSKFKFISSS